MLTKYYVCILNLDGPDYYIIVYAANADAAHQAADQMFSALIVNHVQEDEPV